MNFLLPFLNIKVLGSIGLVITLGLLIKIYHFDPISDLKKEVNTRDNTIKILDANVSNLIVESRVKDHEHKDTVLITEQEHIQEVLNLEIKEENHYESNISNVVGHHNLSFGD